MTPREDDSTATPPHGDPLTHPTRDGAPASRHGVQLDPTGEPADAPHAADNAVPSTPRSGPTRGETP